MKKIGEKLLSSALSHRRQNEKNPARNVEFSSRKRAIKVKNKNQR